MSRRVEDDMSYPKAACLAPIALASALIAGCASSGMGGGDIVQAGPAATAGPHLVEEQ